MDLTFILFHDMEATDKATTLAQAKPGHRRMGISKTGGFIQSRFNWTHEWNGTYLEDVRQYQVFKTQEVSQREMLEARATVHYQRLGPERPLDSFAFVFMTEELAREHLHELWLREVQCWAIIEGALTRLDDTYDPGPPVKPQWVIDVEAREASRGD